MSDIWSLDTGSVGYEVPTTVLIKRSVLWYIMVCNAVKTSRRFGGTYHPHIQDVRLSRVFFTAFFMLVSFLACCSTLQMEAIFLTD
jgi:hypothetical protein